MCCWSSERRSPLSRPAVSATLDAHRLRALAAQGVHPTAIAQQLGVTTSAAGKRLHGFSLWRPRHQPVPLPALLLLCQAGLRARGLPARTGRTVAAIRSRGWDLRRRGVAVPVPRTSASHAPRRVSDECSLTLGRFVDSQPSPQPWAGLNAPAEEPPRWVTHARGEDPRGTTRVPAASASSWPSSVSSSSRAPLASTPNPRLSFSSGSALDSP